MNKSPLSHQEFLDSMGEVKIFKQDSFTFPDNGSCVSLAATGQNTHEEYLLDINKKKLHPLPDYLPEQGAESNCVITV